MKQSVTVDGITLTREQVIKAMQELDRSLALPHLQAVRRRRDQMRGVVIIGHAQRAYRRGATIAEGWTITIIKADGTGDSFRSVEHALQYWEVE